ncbi:MAG: isoprenylcysteine carboxylmethyltransferase family protein [Pseudomonadota bacterium]
MKALDIPPVWLALALILAWLQSRYLPVLRWQGGGMAEFVGNFLAVAGLVLMGLAIREFYKARTTPIPRRDPSALISTGVFAMTRNPIYLGDALLLSGLILRWEAALSLVLIPAFVWLIDQRFIRAEEARLRTVFGSDFEAYAAKVRRWV